MASDEWATGRCSIHQLHEAVAACAGCGRTLCLSCAIPVRGEIYGAECLGAILGPDALDDPGPSAPARVPLPLTGVGFALALLATFLPWKAFGLGSGLFGAYGLVPRGAWLVVCGAVLGSITWLLGVVRKTPGQRRRRILQGAGIAVVLGAILSIVAAPGFGPLAAGPFVALIGGTTALYGTRASRAPKTAITTPATERPIGSTQDG